MNTLERIQMVDLKRQYLSLKQEIDTVISECLTSGDFINGSYVRKFQQELADYLAASCVVTCANGTDALQLAMMGLGLRPGDEVIVPAFNYVATAEVVALLGLTPVWADVDPETFCLTAETVENVRTSRTSAIVPVHLFGQCVDMEPLLTLADKHALFVIEDTAQAIGSTYRFASGDERKAGTMGDIGCTSFFPSKNLGCYGDGGALYTNQAELGQRLRMIANHGQRQKYIHECVGINSRLDTVQAAILSVKLQHLTDANLRRQQAADRYDALLAGLPGVQTPVRAANTSHVFHQYTLKIADGRRDALQAYLKERGIPSMIYYPMAMHQQPAYRSQKYPEGSFPIAEALCSEVLSLPMHPDLNPDEQEWIVTYIHNFIGGR